MESEFCTVRKDGRVCVITIDRPEVMNSLHPMAHIELARAFDDFQEDPDAWVAIITGTGERAFCAGTDLKFMAETGRDETPGTGFAGLTRRFDLVKPVIAAVNGVALGGGLEIVMACDLVIAADHAVFGFPEPRIGQAALDGLQRLARQIPLKLAMGMTLTGRRVSAGEAKTLGFVNDVVPAADLERAAADLAAEIVSCAPLSVQATKATIMESLDSPTLADAMARLHPLAEKMRASDDAREGPRAFAEKRQPKWTGH